jgi:hypothetical protein
MAVVTIACGKCGREFEVDEEQARPESPGALDEPYLAVPEHQDSAGLRCGGSNLPGELRGAA